MKKIALLFLLGLTVSNLYAQAQLPKNLGSKTLYVPQQLNYTKLPVGYQAVYVNFLGRHGARHLTKEVNVSYAYQMLFKADSLGGLTIKGKQLKLYVQNLNKVEMNKVGSISENGVKELELIAKRMYQQQPNVFAEQPNLLVATTKKGRTKESAAAFLTGLIQLDSTTNSHVKFNYGDDDNLRFYDFSPSYLAFEENGNWKAYYNKLALQIGLGQITTRFCRQIFITSFSAQIKKEDQAKFVDDIYGFYTILPAIGEEIKAKGFYARDMDFASFFIKDELIKLNRLNAYEDYLLKGPGLNKNGIQVKIAAPLLADFIKSTDAFMKNKEVKADLRFAHAETVAPFAALLDFKPAATASTTINRFDQLWNAGKIIPFSANIQWIIYKKANSKDYLVKFLLNEKEVSINGLETSTFPYYSWDSVRRFYLKKLSFLNFKLTDDPHAYLLGIK